MNCDKCLFLFQFFTVLHDLFDVCDVDMHCVAETFTQRGAEQASYIRQLVVIGLFVKGGPCNYRPTHRHNKRLYCGHNRAANQAYTHGAH